MRTGFVGLLIASVLLTGCMSTVKQDEPARVESRTLPRTSASTEQGAAVVQAYRPPARVQVAKAQPQKAVQVLQRRANDQLSAGDYTAAAASLERALRIAPRDAKLWNSLAHVRAAQKRYAQVEQLASKSNQLSNGNARLNAENWGLIADARRARGDRSGARQARERASLYQ